MNRNAIKGRGRYAIKARSHPRKPGQIFKNTGDYMKTRKKNLSGEGGENHPGAKHTWGVGRITTE